MSLHLWNLDSAVCLKFISPWLHCSHWYYVIHKCLLWLPKLSTVHKVVLPCLGLIGLIGDCEGDIRHNNSHRGDTPSNCGSGVDSRKHKKASQIESQLNPAAATFSGAPILREYSPPTTCHISCVACHKSCLRCHMTHVTCHIIIKKNVYSWN